MEGKMKWEEEIDKVDLGGDPEAVSLIRILWKREPIGKKVMVRGLEWVIYDYNTVRDTLRSVKLMALRGQTLVQLYVEVLGDWKNGDSYHVSHLDRGYRISDMHNYRLRFRQEMVLPLPVQP